MPCLDDLEVLDYVELRLPEASLAAIRQHLDSCGDCLNLVSQLADATPRTADGLTLGRTIASGGMGMIVEAYDARLDRRIAVKLPRADDTAAQRRFEREVKITARRLEPALVPVYAAGTLGDGEPYYAMRLVDGESLDRVIDKAAGVAGRLALVRAVTTVAGAIAYAHSQSIIHRDIKPANVLVGSFGEVVVIDWGLARVIGDDAELATGSPGPVVEATHTVDGAVVGTPAYMAPEQARGEPLDERADVYALGALLYHVLRGKPPGPGAPADLAGADVPVDLVAIVGEAMADDPARRYRSAAELAADLERFQTGRLVDAHRYSIWQLVRRWLRKHRAAVAVATILAMVLAITAIVASRKIHSAEATATTQHDASDDLVDYMLADLQTRLTKIGKLEVLEGIGRKLDDYYTTLGSTAALSQIDRSRWSHALDILGDVTYAAGDLAKAEALYGRALDQRRALEAAGAPRAEVLANLGTSHAKLGKVQRETGEKVRALASFEASRAAFAELAMLEPANLECRRQQAHALHQIGRIHIDLEASAPARASLTTALAITDELLALAPKTPGFVTMKIALLGGLGDVAVYAGELERAFALATQASVLAEQLDGAPENRKTVAATQQKLGDVASRRGDRKAALAAHRRSALVFEELAAHDPDNATWRSNLALALNRIGGVERALGHRVEAATAYERARALRQALVERDPKNATWLRDLGDSHDRLASVDLDLGKVADADRRYRASIAITEQLIALEPANTRYRADLLVALGNMARIARMRGDTEAALGWYRKRLETAKANVAADPANKAYTFSLSNAYEDMATILMDRDDSAHAREAAARSLALREQLVAASPHHVVWRRALATSYEELASSQDDAKVARGWIAKALPHRRALVAKDPSDVDLQVDLALALTLQARIARAQDDYEPAAASQVEAVKLHAAIAARDPKNLISASQLAQAHEIGGDIAADQKRTAEAIREYTASIAALAPFLDAGLGDAHVAVETAESKWKLAQVSPAAERGTLVREARAILEQLQRAKRLPPDRARLLADVTR